MAKEREIRQILVELQMESGMEVKCNLLKKVEIDGEEHVSTAEDRIKAEAVVNAAVALVTAVKAHYAGDVKYTTKTTAERIAVEKEARAEVETE